jgi:hypothetical protein
VGLITDPSGPGEPKRTPELLKRPHLLLVVEATLNHLRVLLSKADVITGRYDQEGYDKDLAKDALSTPRAMTMFRDGFERFKVRIRKNQKQQSAWKVTRWFIHDCERFRALITNVRELLDDLERATQPLAGVQARQRDLLSMEITSISDTDSLRLLQAVGESEHSSQFLHIAADFASLQLSVVTASSAASYHTAHTHVSVRVAPVTTGLQLFLPSVRPSSHQPNLAASAPGPISPATQSPNQQKIENAITQLEMACSKSNPLISYILIKQIGQGSFGKVYTARSLNTKDLVAIKNISVFEGLELHRIADEILVTRQCKHPNTVNLIESFWFGKEIWAVMDYMDGGTLGDLLAVSPFSEGCIAHISHKVLLGLVYLHDQGVIHRDIKSANILLSVEGKVKLGLSPLIMAEPPLPSELA